MGHLQGVLGVGMEASLTTSACELPAKVGRGFWEKWAHETLGPPFQPFGLSPKWRSNTQFINVMLWSPELLACAEVHILPALP